MKKISILSILICTLFFNINAQIKVGKNKKSINPSALFELESDTSGILLPRVALVGLSSFLPLKAHVQGMVVYNTAVAFSGTDTALVKGLYYNNGTNWKKLIDNVTNIYTADGKIGSNRKVEITDKLSFDNQTLNISSKLHAVGVGTSVPDSSAVLEVNSKTQGFLPPRMTKAQMDAIVRPQEGLMVYCYDCRPFGMYNYSPNKWVPIADAILEDAVFTSGTLNCQSGVVASQTGTYSQGLAMTSTNTKTVLVTVVSVGKFTAKTDTANGVTWEQVAPSIFAVGAGSQIKLQAKGTPLSIGTYTYTLTVSGGLSCTFTITYTSPATFDCANLTQTDLSPAGLYMVSGTAYTQTITVPYTAGNGTAYGSSVSTSQGLTITRVAGTYAAGGGNITYNLTGTYTGPTGSNFVTFTTPDGFCPIQVNAYSVSIVANANNSLQMDNLKVTIGSVGGYSQNIAAVRKNANFVGSTLYHATCCGNSGLQDNINLNVTTTNWPKVVGWNFPSISDEQTSYLRDVSNNRWYRITTVIGDGYNNNLMHIERMDVNIPGISSGGNVSTGVAVTIDNLKVQVPSSGNSSLQGATTSGTFSVAMYNAHGYVPGLSQVTLGGAITLNTTFAYFQPTHNYGGNNGNIDIVVFIDNWNTYKATHIRGVSGANNLVHIEKLSTTATPMSAFLMAANPGTDLTYANFKIRMASSGNTAMQISTVTGSIPSDMGSQAHFMTNVNMTASSTVSTITTTPSYVIPGWTLINTAALQTSNIRDKNNNTYYKSMLFVGGGGNNNILYMKKY